MGTYIVQSDVENLFGTQNVAEWSNLDNDGTGVVAARVAAGIAYAEGYIEDRFREGPYIVPFVNTGSGTPVVLKDWCARLAGAWLYRSRPPHAREQDRMSLIVQGMDNEIDSYITKGRKMQLARYQSTAPTVPICVFPGQPYAPGSFGPGT